MRLLYLANNRIPSEKANSLQIMRSCAAFQKLGADVTLVVPHRVQPRVMRSVRDPFAYYGIEERFRIRRLPCLDTLEIAPEPLQPAAFALQASSFAIASAACLARGKADIYYSRDPLSMVLMAAAPEAVRQRTAFEAHTFPMPGYRRQLHVWATRRLGKLVCITNGLAAEYAARGIDPGRLLVAPDAVDLDAYRNPPSKVEARAQLGLPLEAKIACYAGHLYPWKGVHTLVQAARHLPDDHLICIVGGTSEDMRALRTVVQREGLENVQLVGHVPPTRVPTYLAAADVLVLPNSGKSEVSARYTSPMKLFEYMAARRPIVASRLPSLQEILRDGDYALLVEPDNPEALATGISRVVSDPYLAEVLSSAAWRDVQGNSWEARGGRILGFLGAETARCGPLAKTQGVAS